MITRFWIGKHLVTRLKEKHTKIFLHNIRSSLGRNFLETHIEQHVLFLPNIWAECGVTTNSYESFHTKLNVSLLYIYIINKLLTIKRKKC